MNYEHLGEICEPELPDDLEHHGILGMRWGVRRWQPYPKGTRKGKFLGLDRDADIRVGKKPKAYSKGTHGEVLGVSRDQDIRIKKRFCSVSLTRRIYIKTGPKLC